MGEARKLMGADQVMAGNLNPVKEVRDARPEEIIKRLEACQLEAGSNFIVAAGCEIARGTPAANVLALSEFAKFGGGT